MNISIPIVLLVSERSGSNLLRTLLGNHKHISAPVPPHLMNEFYPLRNLYGDLREDSNKRMILTDMVDLVNHPYHDWKLDKQDVLNEDLNDVSSVVSAFRQVFASKAKAESKLHFCSKGIHAFEFIDQYRAELQNVKFVHLVRDPRDHVASWLKRPIKLFTAYDIIKKWKKEQALFIDAATTRGLNYISIRYEDLIQDSAKEMTKVLNYLELDIDQNCFSTNLDNVESKRNEYWENLSKPIMSENSKKYKKQLSEKEILIVESMVKKEMEFFNYPLETSANWKPTAADTIEIENSRETRREGLNKKPAADIELLQDKWKHVSELVNRLKENKEIVNFRLTKLEAKATFRQKVKKAAKIMLSK